MQYYNTRQVHQHRQTTHRLKMAADLSQNIDPKLLNTLPKAIKLEINPTNSKFCYNKFYNIIFNL